MTHPATEPTKEDYISAHIHNKECDNPDECVKEVENE